jgi:hypothetical protein
MFNKKIILVLLLFFSLTANLIFIGSSIYFYCNLNEYANTCIQKNCQVCSEINFNDLKLTQLKTNLINEQRNLVSFIKNNSYNETNKNKLIEIIKNIHNQQFEIQKEVAVKLFKDKSDNPEKYNDDYFKQLENNMCK